MQRLNNKKDCFVPIRFVGNYQVKAQCGWIILWPQYSLDQLSLPNRVRRTQVYKPDQICPHTIPYLEGARAEIRGFCAKFQTITFSEAMEKSRLHSEKKSYDLRYSAKGYQ